MYPPPTDDQIRAILDRHGLPVGSVERSLYEGSVNYVRLVGDHCVRVLKVEDFSSDLYTEIVSVPALRTIGVTTPELIVFDDSREIVPGLVTIYRRLPGIPLGESAAVTDPKEVLREIGRQIALWQTGMKALDDPNGWLDRPRHDHAWTNLERNADRLSAAEVGWVERTLRRLEAARESSPAFVHWDLHANNVLVDRGGFVAILDWGDAGWGDPSLNFQRLPADWLPELLEPLGELDDDFVGRCLYGALAYALNDVHREEDRSKPYANTGHRRWRGLETLARTSVPEVWRRWLGEGPPNP